jgi:hypothetical protein
LPTVIRSASSERRQSRVPDITSISGRTTLSLSPARARLHAPSTAK